MKFIIAILMLGTMVAGEELCEMKAWMERLGSCFYNSPQLGEFFDGQRMVRLQEVCMNGQMNEFSKCMQGVIKECYSEWYDMPKMMKAYDNMCNSTDFCPQSSVGNCAEMCPTTGCGSGQQCCSNGCGHQCMNPDYSDCDIGNSQLAMCMGDMRRMWEQYKDKQEDQSTIYCHLYGGMKNCMRKEMKCKYMNKFEELLDSFTGTSCHGYTKCYFCPEGHSSSATTITTTYLSSIVGAFVLFKIF